MSESGVEREFPTIVRVVVEGNPADPDRQENFRRARRMLTDAFENRDWPGQALVAGTPGGFVHAPFPHDWNGNRGWSSQPEDFRALLGPAGEAVNEVLTSVALEKARGRARFLTLGIDFYSIGKRKMDRQDGKTHAELVAIIDLDQGKPVGWTGKSYPVSGQERTLVQERALESHRFHVDDERVLVLGCHDLNMFSPRARAAMKDGSERYRRSQEMREMVEKFKPTIILQHPHSTDSPRIWSTAWSGARQLLPCSRGARHVWASGIGYYTYRGKERSPLHAVLRSTRWSEKYVIDIYVKSPWVSY